MKTLLVLLCAIVAVSLAETPRSFAQTPGPRIELVPQELYGAKLLALLDEVSSNTKKIRVLQFNFFTDNPGNSVPKQVAQKLAGLKKQFPALDIEVLLESKKDLNRPDGKGAAQRNAVTKKFFQQNDIATADVYGLDAALTPVLRQGVSHAKVVVIDDLVLAGSTNLTQQSTTVSANNEMNLLVKSPRLAAQIFTFIDQVKADGGHMHPLAGTDGLLEVFTDTLLFDKVAALIDQATSGTTLSLSMYQFMYRDDQDAQAKTLFEKLVAAKKRGASIRVFLERTKDPADETTKTNARVAQLLSAEKIEVYLDPVDKISHSKFLVSTSALAKIAIIGSSNYYRGDFNENHQVNWQVKDHPVIDQLLSYYTQKVAYEGENYRVASGQEKPKRMFRFWRGFRQAGVNSDDLIKQVNSRLIPETIRVGEARGLDAYLPVFLPIQRLAGTPDEIALINYANEETYNAIRSTSMGRAYGPIHFEPGAFARDKSSSVVLGEYSGALPASGTGGFMLGDLNADWQSGMTSLRILPLAPNNLAGAQNHLDLLQKQAASGSLIAAAVLVEGSYLLEYLHFKDATQSSSFGQTLLALGDQLSPDHSINLDSLTANQTRLGAGEGASIQFKAALDPASANLQIVLDEIQSSHAATVRFQFKIRSLIKEMKSLVNFGLSQCAQVFR